MSSESAILNVESETPAGRNILETDKGFQYLFEQSPNGIGVLTTEGKIFKTNSEFCRMLGYTKDELKGRHLTSITHVDDINLSLENLQKLIDSETQNVSQTKRYYKKDGSVIWARIVNSALKDHSGRTQYIIGTIEDITQKRINDLTRKIVYNISNAIGTTDSLEELITTIKAQLSTLIDTTNFYVAIYNQADDSFSLPYYSDMYDDHEEFESFPAEKTISEYVYQTKSPLLATPDIMMELEKENKIKLVGPSSRIWLGIPLIFKGECFGVMAVQSYTDAHAFNAVDLELLEHVSQQISIAIARKKSEEELNRALESARQADRVKSAFLSTMSHELRTPLNAVIGFSEILKGEAENAETQNYADIIYSSGNHLLELVEGLFDITLIEAGNVKMKKEDIALHKLMQDINAIIEAERIRMDITDLEIKLDYDINMDFVIHSDRTKLKQILLNLLKNALKFTPKGCIKFGCYFAKKENGRALTFFVKDTGIGIPANKLDYIFKSFNQIDDTHSRNHDGAGIGLSVARQLAELLGGKIWVKSEVDIGSEFIFTIAH